MTFHNVTGANVFIYTSTWLVLGLNNSATGRNWGCLVASLTLWPGADPVLHAVYLEGHGCIDNWESLYFLICSFVLGWGQEAAQASFHGWGGTAPTYPSHCASMTSPVCSASTSSLFPITDDLDSTHFIFPYFPLCTVGARGWVTVAQSQMNRWASASSTGMLEEMAFG